MIKKINSILFVCTGNTCRSVIAEYTFKEMAKDSLFNLKVSSAGISALEEMGLLSKTKEVLEKNNIPISSHKPTQIKEDLVRESNLILTMSQHHKEQLSYRYPESLYKIYLLSEYVENSSKEIIDPYGLSLEAYQECFWTIKSYIEKLLLKLKNCSK